MVEPAAGSAVTTALASPVTLLMEEEQHGDRQAEDVLLLSFTTDLGFLEAFALGVAQACGARVTVVGDARMSSPDPRAARRAGRTYLPGQAICDGAFHPKLVLITGPQRVTAAIGSGNATLAGWQGNAEPLPVPGAAGDPAGPAAIDQAQRRRCCRESRPLGRPARRGGRGCLLARGSGRVVGDPSVGYRSGDPHPESPSSASASASPGSAPGGGGDQHQPALSPRVDSPRHDSDPRRLVIIDQRARPARPRRRSASTTKLIGVFA